ncbi:MAG: signal peptidase I [Candidatus Omnitrophica bacterium]|nr:signal peptidase I [Candidatus Omnitrophota bacterium]
MQTNKARAPVLALIYSVLIAGLGQVYAGRLLRGISFQAVVLFINLQIAWTMVYPSTKNVPPWMTVLSLLVLAVNAVDAFLCGQRANIKEALDLKDGFVKLNKPTVIFAVVVCTVGLLVSILSRAFIVVPFRVPGDSMADTLKSGDRVFVNKRIYKAKEPGRGDVIAFRSPREPRKIVIKRVVATGGDSLEIKDGKLYVNGQAFEQEPMKSIHYSNAGVLGGAGQKISVPANSYYVLGDNSKSSLDSRYYGPVPRANVIGKAYKIYEPIERAGEIK